MRQFFLPLLSMAVFFAAVVCTPVARAAAGPASPADPASSGASTMILPHAEVSSSLNTGISLLNREASAVEVTLEPYGSDGAALGPGVKIRMAPGASYLASLSRALGAGPSLSWVRISATGRVTGFAMIGNDDRITRVPLESRASRELTLPYLISRDDIYTSLHILNAGTAPAELVIRSFSSSGEELGVVRASRPLGPGAKLTGTVRSILGPGRASTDASWLIVSSGQPLVGVALIGAPGRLFSVPME